MYESNFEGSLHVPSPSIRVDINTFPDSSRPGSTRLPTTIPNVEHLLSKVGIRPQYDEITKELTLNRPDGSKATENEVTSLMVFNGLNSATGLGYLPDIGVRNAYNPVREWIDAVPWDQQDRLNALYETVIVAEEYPEDLKRILLYRWLLSATAAAVIPGRFKTRGVLTFQGPQGCGKTSWIGALVSDPVLREKVIRLDHQLDAGNKDSIIGAISCWIGEIGELESSLKRDIGKIKGFLTLDCDRLRRPYGRGEMEYPRRTVFGATVNDHHFLLDPTGNNRWLTIAVTKLNFQHGIDMQQVFAQLAIDVRKDVQWWLTHDEEQKLNAYNLGHRSVSVVRERILEAFNLSCSVGAHHQSKTAIEVLIAAGIAHPNNVQCKEAGSVLREYLGAPKRIQGRDRWHVPTEQQAGYDFTRKPRTPPAGDVF